VSEQVTEDSGVSVSAALDRSGPLPAVSLTVASSRETPVVAVVEHEPPAGTSFASADPATESEGSVGAVSLPAGRLRARVVLGPEETVSFAYPLDSDPESDLSAPRVTAVAELAPDDPPEVPIVRWVGADETLTLAAREGGSHPLAGENTPVVVEAVGSPAGTPIDGVALPAPTRWRAAADRPAIGIVVTRENADAAYGAVLRAQDRGFRAFVAPVDGDGETRRIAARLGAVVVDPEEADGDATLRAERALSRAARDRDHPGVVFQSTGCPRIDYDATLDAFERDGFEVRAVPEADGRRGPGSVLVAIPAYNAEATIGEVVREAARHCEEVLVVDDGSKDGTAMAAREAGATVVIHPRNRGYGGALKTAFEEAARREVDDLVTLDADGQHDPADIPRLLESRRTTGADVVVGSRYAEGSNTRLPRVRAVGLAFVNGLTNLSLGRFRPRTWLRDTQSGYRLYSGEAAESLSHAADIGDGMWASTDIIYHLSRERFAFAEVGTTIEYELENTSSESPIEHGVGLVRNIVAMLQHTHPLVLVGVPGIVTVLVGTLLGVISLQRALGGESAMQVTIAATLALLLGVVMVGTAVLLHVINTHPMFRADRWR